MIGGGVLEEIRRAAARRDVGRLVTGLYFAGAKEDAVVPQQEGTMNAAKGEDLLTAGAIAKALGATDAKVKKAIKELAVKPKAKKGVCNYYSPDVVAKIRSAIVK